MTFSVYLDRCEELRRAGIDADIAHQPFWGLGGGCYSEWLDGWVDVFGDRFRILFFDDIVNDPPATVKEICNWLAIDSGVVDDFRFSVNNKTEQYHNRMLQRAAVTLNRRGERFFHQHRAIKSMLRRTYYSVNRDPAESDMPAAERARLTDFYRPYNARLSEQLAHLGLALPPCWSQPS
ncbi:MAG: hypothetical protein H0V07_03075 [Propionibacteriales bacterium]|nr:hypothetical protein [Propionibacteriales bacterium]